MSTSHLGLFLAVSTLVSSTLHAAEPQIRVVTDGDQRPVAVEAIGWSKDDLARFAEPDSEAVALLRQRLNVYVLNENGETQIPAIGGNYRVVADAVRFTPQFPLRPGMNYQVCFFPPSQRPGDTPTKFTKEISIPALPPTEPTRVTIIYPSASTLPENQLRFYVHFSAPMAAGNAYEHVKLLKANGEVVGRAFLEIGEELWDGSGQRLTLLFDPGRVKKGLSPRAQFGPVLESGQTYRLVIDKAWRDATSQPLVASFEKVFTAGSPLETAVDFKQWQITPPVAGTREALVIRFPRSLDRALLMRMITVADANGKEIAGQITLADDERRWEFSPTQLWVAGQFAVVVDTALEDSTGNNLARPFEVDVFEQVDKQPGPEFVRIPFTVSDR